MPLPDLIILLILFGFALSGVRRGMIWEMFTAAGLGLGFYLTYTYRQDLTNVISRYTGNGWERQWILGLAFLASFMLVYLCFAAIGHKIHSKVETTAFKWPDRVLGVLAGLAKGIVLIALLVMATDMLDREGRVREFVDQSKLVRWGRKVTYSLIHWEPRERRDWV